MGSPRSLRTQRRIFVVALSVIACMALAIVVLLDGRVPVTIRQTVTSAGFVLAGVTAACACAYRARQTSGRRRRSWTLFTVASATAVGSNSLAALAGHDPVNSPSLVADLFLVAALVLAIIGLLTFPSARRRGTDQVLMILDGLVTGGGVLAIVSVLVYPELIAAGVEGFSAQTLALTFAVLDSLLATVALLLLLRASGPDRPMLMLIAAGFLSYAVGDLVFAVMVADGTFAFGTRLDLAWICGYLVIALAAFYPSETLDEPPARTGRSESRGAVLVFAVILAVGTVQMIWGDALHGPTALWWLLLVLAAGARQAILSRDNNQLRAGLECRVAEQTAHLRVLARENEVLLSSVGDGIYGVDLSGRITFVNPSAASSLGMSPEELLGVHAHQLFHSHQDGGCQEETGGDAGLECYIVRAIRAGEVVTEVADTYRRAGGAAFPVEVTAAPVIDPDDEYPRGAVVVFRDVTARREVDRMKNEFLSVVSHELRTPLTAIRGSLGLLAGGAVGELDARAASMVGVAAESSERLTRLIDDLLDIERIGSGASAMRLGVIDTPSLLADAVSQIEGLAAPQGIRVEVGPSSGRALGDEDQVMQTLTNLLGNAIKFSDPGGRVVVEAVPRDGHVLFRVSDDGRGIPADKLEDVFVPFAQVDSTDSRQKGGTGLGLTICRSIVERHGGTIWAESEEGAGTTVSFTLPVAHPVNQVREAS